MIAFNRMDKTGDFNALKRGVNQQKAWLIFSALSANLKPVRCVHNGLAREQCFELACQYGARTLIGGKHKDAVIRTFNNCF